jgi:class 3 adenylate cyclase
LVDDNRVNRLLLGRALEQLGHAVTFAENGLEALEALRQRRVDLVLLDIEMPEMNGYQVLEALAANPRLRDLPVVMMSSVEEVDSVARCIEMGAEDYLFKPVNPVLLKARIGASLEKKRLRDQQRELFRKFATAEVAEELLTTGLAVGGKHVEASVMFSDIRSFSSITETLSPVDTIELLNSYYTLMFDAIGAHGGIINQMLGDGLMAIFGAPLPRTDHRDRVVRAALEMLDLVDGFNREQARRGGVEIRIGVGISSGPVIAGFTGAERRVTYTCVGDTVNLAAHLETHTKVIGQSILIADTERVLRLAAVSEPQGGGSGRGAHAHTLPERRGEPGARDQPGGEPAHAGGGHRDGMGLAAVLAAEPAEPVVPAQRRARGARARKVGSVALARKLLIELWRFLEHGVIPDDARLKAA